MESDSKKYISEIIKSHIEKQKISLHKLSAITGISLATLSRIMNAKQSVSIVNLEKLSKALDIPITDFFDDEEFQKYIKSKMSHSKELNFLTEYADIICYENIIDRIQKELHIYEEFAMTEEGVYLIHHNFENKLSKINALGPYGEKLRELYMLYKTVDLSHQINSIIGGALLYFIIPTDIIPDSYFGIGYLDDILVIQMAIDKVNAV